MKKRLLLFLFISCLFGYVNVDAQGYRVTGTTSDASTGETLPGVNIIVKGTTAGTISDIKGNYSIEVPTKESVLAFSYIGYKPETILVNGRSTINIRLVQDIKKLDEVVVTAYGTTKRSDLSTAQTTVTAKQLNQTVNTTLEQALQGRTAGVYITQNSGQPGGGISVNIRGVNSINGTNEPLYVIDGVQIQGQSVSYGNTSSSDPLAGLNPSDIESIQVLQGPSATALYGSLATNGVLLITTKRGKAGDTKISYSYQTSLQAPPKHLQVMNLPEYATMVNQFHQIESGTTPQEFLDPTLLGNGTDWQSALFKNSVMYQHQISLSGGSKKTTYFMSGEYLNQQGVATGSGFNRYSFRLNLENQTRQWLKVGVNLNYNQTNQNLTTSSESLIASALTLTPQIPVKNLDGTWGGGDNTNGANQYAPVNPVAIANLVTNNDTRRQLLGGMNIAIDIMKGLVFRTSYNANLSYDNSVYYRPTYAIGWDINTLASLTNGSNVNTYWDLNELLDYTRQFGKHNFDLMVSHEAQASTWKNVSAGRTGFLTNDIFDLNAGDPNTASDGGGQGTWGMESYLGRLNYNYADRYIVSASVRSDGSSNFGANNRWGTFPAISAAWRISKEPWYHLAFMNELKLRLETGTTGNQGGGGIYSPMGTNATQWGTGFLPTQYSNPNLKWESTTTDNIGANINLFNNRLQLEFDYYKKNTDNLLMTNPEPYYMGTSGDGSIGAPTVNIGAMQNIGWAFTLNSTNINTKSFRWETNFNISGFKPKITKLYSNSALIDRSSWWMTAGSGGAWTQRSQVGQAPWQFLGYIQEGLFKSVDEINNSAVPVDNNGVRLPTDVNDVWVGDIKYKDISGPNGVPDGIIDQHDQTIIGNPWPKFFGGFTNTFSYKGFDLSVLLTFTYGNDIYNYIGMIDSNPNNINTSRNLMVAAFNYAKPVTNADGTVTLQNPNAYIPRISYGPNGNWDRFTNRWVESGSFLRVKNISLTYNVPPSFIAKQNLIKDIKVTLSAQNVATITGYKGYDPEVGAYVGANASSSNQAIGVDDGRYPLTPVYTFNVTVNF
jgi:TonB-linked SusC/RagA family outer membrane protein